MEICRVRRDDAEKARGIVIVIDVLRAFTVAGYAFERGMRGLWLVRSVEDARALRTREPEALLAGEVGGRLIPGFDFNNSPSLMAGANVRGRLLIQRTGAGTQGAVNAVNADTILLCALTNARATACYARSLLAAASACITLMPTGTQEDFAYGNEDEMCADYVEALLREREDAPDVLARGIADLRATDRLALWKTGSPDFPYGDIAAVLDADRFNFAMIGEAREWQGIRYVDVHKVDV
ncbi:MAG TPA: 2-phosphosulfolactate phosphatase [Ktedonobacteraceae bacterium]|nr:2-phosphosulfolactate phosphatase [Ktedonobacteraceae bacterium]